jgi:hypothetical protein
VTLRTITVYQTPAFAAQATAAGNADGDAADNNSISVQVEGNAVTSAAAEISPNSVVMSSVVNAFVYDVLPTINAADTGVNVMAITAPAGYTNLSVTGVSVGGAGQALNCALGAGEYCVNIVGQAMTITLGTKVTVSGTNIRRMRRRRWEALILLPRLMTVARLHLQRRQQQPEMPMVMRETIIVYP